MEISFNRNQLFSTEEKEFITRVLRREYQGRLKKYEVINVLRPIHYSNDDTLPHFTFRIFNKLTHICDVGFLRFQDLKGYVWTEENGELTLEFVTQYINKKSVVV
jgi:hypothetical protein